MKISELRARDNYDINLLQIVWDCRRSGINLGHPAPADKTAKTQWYEHPFFSVYVTADFCDAGRKFLKQQYAYAPSRVRRPAQRAAVELMSRNPVFRAMLKPAFSLPAAPDDACGMWMPGNQRFRYFNFENHTIDIFPKKDFAPDGICREIQFRKKYSVQFPWIVPILRDDEETSSFEEPLLDMHPINRESSETRRREGMSAVRGALDDLHKIECRDIHPEAYLDYKKEQFEKNCAALKEKFGGLDFSSVRKIWWRSAKIISEAPNVTISMTHGDFQPGNVLIGTHRELAPSIALIDWEDAAMRASVYDEMTWILRARSPHGLYQRVDSFLKCPDSGIFSLSCKPALAVALWSIEEWNWLCEVSARPGIVNLPAGLCTHFKEILNIR